MTIESTESFLEYYEKVRDRTRRVVLCIPSDKIDWTYQSGKFTLGDIVRHIAAIERWMFVENFLGRPSQYSGCSSNLAKSFPEIVAYFDSNHEESVKLIRTLSVDDLKKKCTTPGGASLSVWKWMRLMVEHEIHHRGQIYLYLGMLGVNTPPIYGLTSEQVAEKSKSELR